MKDLIRRYNAIYMVYGSCLFILIAVAIAFRFNSVSPDGLANRDRLLPASEQIAPERAIELGVFVDNFYAFQAESKIYDANGWVWLKWPRQIQDRLVAKSMSPEKLLVFANQIDDWDFSLVPDTESPVIMSDGRYYQRFKFSGHFYVDNLDYRKYPFQTIKIPLVFELDDSKLASADGTRPGLVMDRVGSGVGSYIDMGGYTTKGFELKELVHEYSTSMGGVGKTLSIPQARIEVAYYKSTYATFLKLMLPLITIMTLALFAPSLSSSGWDVRVGIPPTALLTLIFLQQTYEQNLPELPYITFMDSIYNVCYVVNLVLFGLFLWGSNELHEASDENRASVISHVDKIDERFQIGLTLLLILAIILNWFTINLGSA